VRELSKKAERSRSRATLIKYVPDSSATEQIDDPQMPEHRSLPRIDLPKVFWTDAGRTLVHDRYRSMLASWPTRSEQLRIPTCQGETFVLAFGPEGAPPLVLFHGGVTTSVMWFRSAAAWSQQFRVFAVDLIGEPGFSAASRPSMASDHYARWLDDVWVALKIECASVVGASLGGWLALDYAIRRPARVSSLALLAPAGVGRVRLGFLLKAGPLLLMGPWGHRRALSLDMGFDPSEAMSVEGQAFVDFFKLAQRHYVARTKPIPTFSDQMLSTVTMPVMAVVGAKDAILDSEETKRRLERYVPQVQVKYLPEAGHGLVDPTSFVLEFLLSGMAMRRR
jgi:pimeloyl-ACP methyl ester carboxylesterase